MKISLIDRSLYYKGLMLLIRKDRKIQDEERKIMMRIGEMLGFEMKFCENAIKEIIDNKHIIDSPPHFTEPGIALCFIRDGLRVSASDGQIDKEELAWLESVAETNDIISLWAEESKKCHPIHNCESLKNDLELKHFVWE